jgi:hypothetical protein
MFEGSSNMNYHLLTNLVELFHGSPTKAQMRGYMYRNCVKLYDCEIQLRIVDSKYFRRADIVGL